MTRATMCPFLCGQSTYNGSTAPENLSRGRVASIASDVNDDGVIVGAVAEPQDPWPSGRWFIRPAYWLPSAGGYSRHFIGQPLDPCLEETLLGGIAWGVGPGAEPLVAGSAFRLCQAGEPEAFAATLVGAPSTTPVMMPLNTALFACADEELEELVLSEALAIGPTPAASAVAVGFEMASPTQAGPGGLNCIVPAAQCDGYLQYSVRALAWEFDQPPLPLSIGERIVAEAVDFRFRAFDGAAGAAVGAEPAWSVAGGTSLPNAIQSPPPSSEPPPPCRLHATAYLGYLPGTEMYGVNSGRGVAYDVHDSIVDAADPPGAPGETRTASAIGAICRAEAANEAAVYLAGGTRYPGLLGQSESPYGVLWLGRRDGEEDWEWCGRNVNDFDVAWKHSFNMEVHVIHDVLPSGIAVGLSAESNTSKLVLFTSLCDLNGDFKVSGADLGLLLADWGPGPGGGTYFPGDLDRDDEVDGADLGVLLAAWNGDFVPIHMDCAAKLWLPISPIEVGATATLLGFEGLDGLGTHCITLEPEEASALGQYISTVAQILHQEY